MNGNSNQGFVLSILLHVAIVGAAFLFAMVEPPEKPKFEVFELVSAPPPVSEVLPLEDTIDFSIPYVPLPPVVEPPPPPIPIPAPKPVLPVVPVKQPDPKPKPKPPAPPPVELTYEEFLKQHGQPAVKTKPAPKPPKPVVLPKIDTTFASNLPDVVINVKALEGLSADEVSALDRYIARLKVTLREAWDKPTALAESLATTIEFDVAVSGKLTGVRITKSSGNRTFDESVTHAFAKVGSAGTTPDGKVQQLRLTFRMTDK